jgi:hypothetical protein
LEISYLKRIKHGSNSVKTFFDASKKVLLIHTSVSFSLLTKLIKSFTIIILSFMKAWVIYNIDQMQKMMMKWLHAWPWAAALDTMFGESVQKRIKTGKKKKDGPVRLTQQHEICKRGLTL